MESLQVVDIVLYLATFAIIVYYVFNWVHRTGKLKSDLKAATEKQKATREKFQDITQFERLETTEGSGVFVPLANPLNGEPSTTTLSAEIGKPQRTVPCPPTDLTKQKFATGYYNEDDTEEYSQFNKTDRKWKAGPQAKAISSAILNKITEATLVYQQNTGKLLAELITQADNRVLLARALFDNQYDAEFIIQLDKKIADKVPLTETESRVHRTFYSLADPDTTLEDQLLGRLQTELDAKSKLLATVPGNITLRAEVEQLTTRLEGRPVLNKISNIKEKYRAMVQDTRSAYGMNPSVDNAVSYLDTGDSAKTALGPIGEYYLPRQYLNAESHRRYMTEREQDQKVLSPEEFQKKYAWVDLIGKNSLPPVDDPFRPQPGLSQAKAAGLRSVMDILTDYDVNNYKCQRIYQECGTREAPGFPLKAYTYQAYDHYLDKELPTRSEYIRRASQIRDTLVDPETADPDMAMDTTSINAMAGSSAPLVASDTVDDGLDMLDALL